MSEKKDDRVNRILELQEKNVDIEDIVENLNFPSVQSLRSFMNRNGFKSNKGIFTPKEDSNSTEEKTDKIENVAKNKTIKENKQETKKNEIDPNVETVLDLQIYNVPLFKISKMVNMSDFEIEKMMEEHGYIRVGERFVVKPKPIKIKPEKKKKTRTTKKKEKTKKQLLEEEYKKNPAKRGTYDPINQVWVINVQLVEILDLQLSKVPLGDIAKKMKMSKPALIEFMDEKGYVLEDNKFILRKLAKKAIEDEEVAITVEKELKPRVYDNRKENIEFTEESFRDIQNDIQNMLNWYNNIKEHHIFKSLKNSDMEN